MKVISPLANIIVYIGAMKRHGHNLYIMASDKSSLPVKIILSPHDALSMIWAAAKSPSTWLFILLLPFHFLCHKLCPQKHGRTPDSQDEAQSDGTYAGDTLNKPW